MAAACLRPLAPSVKLVNAMHNCSDTQLGAREDRPFLLPKVLVHPFRLSNLMRAMEVMKVPAYLARQPGVDVVIERNSRT